MEQKTCTRCNITKPLGEFYKNVRGYDSECKGCRKLRSQQYHAKNASEQNSKKRLARKENPQRFREYEVKRAYNLSSEQYNELLDSQDNKCIGCRKEFSDVVLPYVDHDHSCCPNSRGTCGKCVRGILCNLCNRSLGLAKDSEETLRNLAAYIEKYKGKECA